MRMFVLAPEAVFCRAKSRRQSNALHVHDFIRAEQQRQPPQHLTHSRWTQNTDAVHKSRPIDGPDLRDIHDAGLRESGIATPQTNVSWHAFKPKI